MAGRIFITGDTHHDLSIHKITQDKFKIQKDLDKEDFLIITGDFGGVWHGTKSDNYILNWHGDKNYTTLFVDGNHENFEALSKYPIEEWNGGKVQFIRPNLIHLMRGQVYTINDKKFFTMGGAASTDRAYRKDRVSWWEEEMPNTQEFEEGFSNLDKVNWEVDYVITHDIGSNIYPAMYDHIINYDALVMYLFRIDQMLSYDKWFFGHHHRDEWFKDKYRCVYTDVIEI